LTQNRRCTFRGQEVLETCIGLKSPTEKFQRPLGMNPKGGQPVYNFAMKCGLVILVCVCASVAVSSHAQTIPQNISPAQLQTVIGLPLSQAVNLRETYKGPLKSAYARQIALTGKDCNVESDQGQQPYTICMGHADEQADKDFAVFYNNLQMLCHDQAQLATLQSFEATWQLYKDSAMKATHASWPDGTGAPGLAGQVYLSLVRNHMRELDEIYGLNIAQ
jgi:uncharacterized protein YecT (DUF1311 family)